MKSENEEYSCERCEDREEGCVKCVTDWCEHSMPMCDICVTVEIIEVAQLELKEERRAAEALRVRLLELKERIRQEEDPV